MSLRGKTCLVLGGGGFIGTHLCRSLFDAGALVEGFGRRSRHPQVLAAIPWHEAEFADQERLADALKGKDVVFHLLGSATPAQSNDDPVSDVEQNLLPTLRLLSLCRHANIGRLIFASSGGTVYGVTGPTPVKEDAATDPITAYGVNKLAIEKYLELNRRLHGVDSVILRISNPYGPFQSADRPQGVIGRLLPRALKGERIEIWGDGSVVRDFLYVEDTVAALIAAAEYRGDERLFNVGSGEGRSLRDVVEAIVAVSGCDPDLVRYLPGRPADVPINVLDISRIKGSMDWRPRTTWEAGMAATAQWLRDDPDQQAAA